MCINSIKLYEFQDQLAYNYSLNPKNMVELAGQSLIEVFPRGVSGWASNSPNSLCDMWVIGYCEFLVCNRWIGQQKTCYKAQRPSQLVNAYPIAL